MKNKEQLRAEKEKENKRNTTIARKQKKELADKWLKEIREQTERQLRNNYELTDILLLKRKVEVEDINALTTATTLLNNELVRAGHPFIARIEPGSLYEDTWTTAEGSFMSNWEYRETKIFLKRK